MPKLIIFSGAGLSQESGIPTFRDTDGTWENYDLNVVANFKTWQKNRDAVFEFYNARKKNVQEAQPNAAHYMIAKWQQQYDDVHVVTQNVDDLLERAGCTDVLHVHGSFAKMNCTSCMEEWDCPGEFNINQLCPHCGRPTTKPGIVMFGERCPNYYDLIKLLEESDEDTVVVVVGTSFNVVVHEMCVPAAIEGTRNAILVDPRVSDRSREFFGTIIEAPATIGLSEVDLLLPTMISSKIHPSAEELEANKIAKFKGML